MTRLYDELLADLYAIQALLQRLEASASALKQENQENAARQQTLITTIQATETEIVEKKGQLQEAREEKSRRLEYEEIRKRIAQIPARSSTKLEMDRVEAEINDLEGQMKELDVIINQRRMHFGGLVSMVDTIYRNSTTTYHQHFGDASCNTIQHESAGMNVLRSTRETEDRDAGEIHEPDGSTPMVVG